MRRDGKTVDLVLSDKTLLQAHRRDKAAFQLSSTGWSVFDVALRGESVEVGQPLLLPPLTNLDRAHWRGLIAFWVH